MWALLRKEFIETIRWAPLGLGLIIGVLALVWSNGNSNSWTNISRSLSTHMALGASIIAIALGTLQSLNDSRNGPRAYLLHRAVTASQLFWAKLIVGACVYLMVCLVPLLLTAAWLEATGVVYRPTRGIQAIPASIAILGSFAFYPAMIQLFNRPANWIGSRSFMFLCVALSQLAVQELINGEPVMMAIVTVVDLVLLVLVTAAARHAFVVDSTSPASGRTSAAQTVLLMTTCITLCSVSAMIVIGTLLPDDTAVAGRYQGIECDHDGQPWLVTAHSVWSDEFQGYRPEFIAGSPLVPGTVIDPMAPLEHKLQTVQFATLATQNFNLYPSMSDLAFAVAYSGRDTSKWDRVQDNRGYLLFYNPRFQAEATLPLMFVVSRDGVHAATEPAGQPFRPRGSLVVPLVFHEYASFQKALTLLSDQQGVYQFQDKSRAVLPLIEQPILSAEAVLDENNILKLFVRQENQIRVYELVDEAGHRDWPSQRGAQTNNVSISLEAPRLVAREVESIHVPDNMRAMVALSVCHIAQGHWTILGSNQRNLPSLVARQTPGRESPDVFRAKLPLREAPLVASSCVSLIAPPIALTSVGVVYAFEQENAGKSFWEAIQMRPSRIAIYAVLILIQAAVAGTLTVWAARHRGLSPARTNAWLVAALLLGWSTPLALLACYHHIVRETCISCQRQRRVDQSRCEHCGAAWPRPLTEGIEIQRTAAHSTWLEKAEVAS